MKKTRIVFLAIAIVLSLILIYWAFRYVGDFPPGWHDPTDYILVVPLFEGALFLTVYLSRFKKIKGLAISLFVVVSLATCYEIMFISDMTKDSRKFYRESLNTPEIGYAEQDDVDNFKTQEQDKTFENQSRYRSASKSSESNTVNRMSKSEDDNKDLSDDEMYDAFMEGVFAQADKDYEKAFNIYQNLAKQGHIKSIVRVGYMYENGLGVEKNYEEAIKYYKFLDGKDPEAMTRLGNLYYEYDLLGGNMKEIARLWLLAAKMGWKEAQLNIGVCYLLGEGVEANNAEAKKWLNKAASQGVQKAKEILDSLEE